MMTFGNVALLNYDNWCVTAPRGGERDACAEQARYDIRQPIHGLRHTFATRLADNGASKSTMLALMGHGPYWSAIPISGLRQSGMPMLG